MSPVADIIWLVGDKASFLSSVAQIYYINKTFLFLLMKQFGRIPPNSLDFPMFILHQSFFVTDGLTND